MLADGHSDTYVALGGVARIFGGAVSKVGMALGVLAACVFAVFVLGAAPAAAEPLCTNTWTGATEGAWGIASNWSAGHVPVSSEVACIGAGKTVTIAEGDEHVGAVEDEGALSLTGGSLELASVLEASKVSSLILERATLTGPGTLDVTSSLLWEEGIMSGSGSTVLAFGASASVMGEAQCPQADLVERTLVNDGTMTLSDGRGSGGQLVMSEGARLENTGAFNDNSGAYDCSPFRATIVQGAGSKTVPFVMNTGTFEETESSTPSATTTVDVPFESLGTLYGKAGGLGFASGIAVTLASGSVLDGSIGVTEATVTAGRITAAGATLTLSENATLQIESGATASVGSLILENATATGAGTLDILSSLVWQSGGVMSGTGKTVVEGGASAEMLVKGATCGVTLIVERTLVNDGAFHFDSVYENTGGTLLMSKGARLNNNGTFYDNSDAFYCSTPTGYTILAGAGRAPEIVNTGIFERTETDKLTTYVDVPFANWGHVVGELEILLPVGGGSSAWGCSEENPSFPKRELAVEEGVCVGSGDLSECQTDFAIGGRGVGLNLVRTYNSQAAEEGVKSTFGNGWTSPYSEHLIFETEEEPETKSTINTITYVQENGSTVSFVEGAGGKWSGPEGSPDILEGSTSAGFALTLEDQDVYRFSGSSGQLESISDRNGNTTTMTYSGGRLEKVSDPAGQSLTFAYNSRGLVESVEDPMKHVVKYSYEPETENLASVTPPGEEGPRWQFKYEGKSQLKEMVDGNGGKTTYKYTEAHRIKSKTDPMGRTTAFEYGNTFTKITNEATKAVTVDYLTGSGQVVETVHGLGTPYATTEAFTYDTSGDILSSTNGDGYTTKYEYDASGNKTLLEDPEGHKTKWTYDATHDIEAETTPDGESTTYKRDSHGNVLAVERPAPHGETQTTSYKYNSYGLVESMTDPLKRTWKYEYNTAGDRTGEIDPEGDRRTWGYNEDSQETAMVSPRGHVTGGNEALFETKTTRDAQGRPTKVITPLGHETTYKYDGDGNLESATDPEGDTTKYVYNADDELEETIGATKNTIKTEYDGAGQVTSQTDGNGHTTKYIRNVLEQVEEVIDPLDRKTLYEEYDRAGNVIKVKNAAKQITTYTYDPDNRLTKIAYSEKETPTVEYEYNADGDRTKMTEGSGKTTYAYDELDRLIETDDAQEERVKYEYNLANNPTKIIYANGKTVTREYDKDERLRGVTDWLGNTTLFAYDADSNLVYTAFPSGTGDVDTYNHNEDDAISEVTMKRSTVTLASLVYTRNKDEEVTKVATKGLPGEEASTFNYDEDSRLESGAGVSYKYDKGNNPVTIGGDTYSYNAADELEKRTYKAATETEYHYNEVGERIKTEPAGEPATEYGYNQARDLTTVTRVKGTKTPAIEDSYGYNGDGLRTSEKSGKAASYLTWDTAVGLPLLLSDGSNSYIYSPDGLPFEQISSEGTVLYLHHDQQGSIRLVTSATGVSDGTASYDAYGNVIAKSSVASLTPMGYDGQYTNSDTGLVYLRAREYDPTTAQFMSVDPAIEATRAPYTYADDDPVAKGDRTGDEYEEPEATSAFGREWGNATHAIQSALGRKGAPDSTIDLFLEYAEYLRALGVYHLNSADSQAQELEQRLEQRVIHSTLGGVISALLHLDFSVDAGDFAINFIKAAEHVYKIHVVYQAATYIP